MSDDPTTCDALQTAGEEARATLELMFAQGKFWTLLVGALVLLAIFLWRWPLVFGRNAKRNDTG